MTRTVPDLLMPAEAAAILGVHGKTLLRYTDAGRIATRRTLGNHRRVITASLRAAMIAAGADAAEVDARIARVAG